MLLEISDCRIQYFQRIGNPVRFHDEETELFNQHHHEENTSLSSAQRNWDLPNLIVKKIKKFLLAGQQLRGEKYQNWTERTSGTPALPGSDGYFLCLSSQELRKPSS